MLLERPEGEVRLGRMDGRTHAIQGLAVLRPQDDRPDRRGQVVVRWTRVPLVGIVVVAQGEGHAPLEGRVQVVDQRVHVALRLNREELTLTGEYVCEC